MLRHSKPSPWPSPKGRGEKLETMKIIQSLILFIRWGVTAIIVAGIALILLRSLFNYLDVNPFKWSARTIRRVTDPVIIPVRAMLMGFRYSQHYRRHRLRDDEWQDWRASRDHRLSLVRVSWSLYSGDFRADCFLLDWRQLCKSANAFPVSGDRTFAWSIAANHPAGRNV